MFQVNSFFSRRFFLLLIIFFNCSLFASYKDIYFVNNQKDNLQFSYALEKGNYRVYLKDSGFIHYDNNGGFKLFVPKFTKSFDLSILRHNSIGKINGTLSISKEFNNIVKETSNNIDSYSDDDDSQLRLLLNNKSINYKNFTYLSFKAENIGSDIKLNKNFYFKFEEHKDNKLQAISYFYYMILDKKSVDKYVKSRFKTIKYHDKTYNYLHTYMLNLNKSANKKIVKTKTVKQAKKAVVRLNLKKLLHMKSYANENITIKLENEKQDIPTNKEKEELLENIKNKISETLLLDEEKTNENKVFRISSDVYIDLIKNNISDMKKTINNVDFPEDYYDYLFSSDSLRKYVSDQKYYKYKLDDILKDVQRMKENYENNSSEDSVSKDQLKKEFEDKKSELINFIDTLTTKIQNTEIPKKENKTNDLIECLNKISVFDEKCTNYDWYYTNYVNTLLNEDKLPDQKQLDKYATFKSLNNLAVYFYNVGQLDKSLTYLDLALKKADDKNKELILFNKAILLSFINTHSSNEEANKYFNQVNIKEAHYNLAINYYIGLGIKEDNKKAIEHFKKAYDLGLEISNENYLKLKKLGY